jgi:tRNA A-37 threonylcarbamoyl transferase component Bud32
VPSDRPSPPARGDESTALATPSQEAAAAPGPAPASPDPERLAAGSQAGDYRIVGFLGAGAMGDVYEGLQPVIGKRVAVKVIKRQLAASQEALERFTREARAVNRIGHPSVLDVFAFGRLADGRLYLVMDFLRGESLGATLRRRGPMPLAEVQEILESVCDALDAAHAQGVVHRDLKPDNVFLAEGKDGVRRVYVLDFGIAKIVHDEAEATRGKETLTGQGAWIGTPLYMAPEQWTDRGAIAASDIYALGAMTYQMIAGRAPYEAKSVPGLMEKHFHAPMPPLDTAAGPSVPAGVAAAVSRALAKQPEDRFPSARAFAAEVDRAIAGGSGAADAGAAGAAIRLHAAAAATVRPTAGHSAVKVSSKALVAAAGLGAAMLAVIVILFVSGGEPAPRPRGTNGPEAPALVTIAVTSSPTGAAVFVDGRRLGVTPTTVEVAPGRSVDVVLRKAGYRLHAVTLAPQPGQTVDAELAPELGFEGVWRLPTGELRSFVRQGERVGAYQLESVGGPRHLLHFFEFTASNDDDTVTFASGKPHIDERAPEEVSCHILLHAEYRYSIASDRLALRRQQVSYDFRTGQCQNVVTTWSDFEPATRLAHASTRTSAESTAGMAPPLARPEVDSQAPPGEPTPVQRPDPKRKKEPPVRPKAPSQKPLPQQKTEKAPPAQGTEPPWQPANKGPAGLGQGRGGKEAAPEKTQTAD